VKQMTKSKEKKDIIRQTDNFLHKISWSPFWYQKKN